MTGEPSRAERGFTPPPAPRPLTGLRVIDLSQNLAGPFCTQILGDLGADVVKVEPLTGDPARAWGPPFWAGQSTLFLSANRNKRSIAVNLKTDDGRAIVERLAASADVFVQSFRRGVIERLGLAWEQLSQANPRLIYCSITAYGSRGPLRDRAGYDPLMQAHGGLMSLTGNPGQTVRVGSSVVDVGTALWATIGIQAALAERQRSGNGSHVVGSLYETTLAWNAYHLLGYWANGAVPRAQGTRFGSIAPYGAFPAKDGQLMIAVANDGLFRRLCDALRLEALATDSRFADNPSRVRSRAELDPLIEQRTRQHTVRELEAVLERAGVPCAPILDIAGVASEEQTWASGIIDRDAGPRFPGPAAIRPPLEWNDARSAQHRPPPIAGEHTRDILAEIGFDPGHCDDLLSRRIVADQILERPRS
ncbi:MAG: CaiB/BaiF CoA transferase family protein [Longimicrobiales bacterium]